MTTTQQTTTLTTDQIGLIRDALWILAENCYKEAATEADETDPDVSWIEQHETKAQACDRLDLLLRDADNGRGHVTVSEPL